MFVLKVAVSFFQTVLDPFRIVLDSFGTVVLFVFAVFLVATSFSKKSSKRMIGDDMDFIVFMQTRSKKLSKTFKNTRLSAPQCLKHV